MLAALAFILCGCQARYKVEPAVPYYILKSPDGLKRFFPESTSGFDNTLEGWIDLGPGISLKLEKAFFTPPESRRILDYRGLEMVQYHYESPGLLRLRDNSTLENRPVGQDPVASVLPTAQLHCKHHRFFFQVVLDKQHGSAQAVLLSGDSSPHMKEAASGLAMGEGCPPSGPKKLYCTAIPESISASIQFEIRANGKSRTVSWRSTVASIVGSEKPVALARKFRGKMVPVVLGAQDLDSLRLPLWPGDELRFGPQ